MKASIIISLTMTVLLLGCSRDTSFAQEKSVEPSTNMQAKNDKQLDDVIKALSVLPSHIANSCRQKISNNQTLFFDILKAALAESKDAGNIFIAVNKTNFLPPSYEPADLVSLDNYNLAVTKKSMQLRKIVMPALLEMNEAAKANGIKLVIGSAYRSYQYQDGLFKRYAKTYGEAEASRFSARPGSSQHQLGTVFDFSPIEDVFADTKAGKWVLNNAARFGFSLSFPKNMEALTGYVWESWHYRYLGKQALKLEQDYFDGIQHYMLEFINALPSEALSKLSKF